eukprot:CAMPEP_0114623486 /NCGR_PEP_ID=MMETSP0168-20121206/10277_1 /TAXON_ID=95228 ORGANISM="Vannella sp., Strain DIVA3 517/6/12" /NCGR_SAMPLE_ID=MMETSP0168 /ASSEMBLY_ACC=CAM_ASM_000044 /LENGTH=188 /DNA_ID=CAMNT_0001834733 /DNA_START=438 /DNA_END=1001 /DNA_ORIENTATION=+
MRWSACVWLMFAALLVGSSLGDVGKLGGQMRVSTPMAQFEEQDWRREIAILVEAEVRDITYLGAFSPSTTVYFQIQDPALDELPDNASEIAKLSGDDKMLLLYSWWVSNDARISELSFQIIDFQVFGQYSVSNGFSSTKEVFNLATPHSSLESLLQANADTNFVLLSSSAVNLATCIPLVALSVALLW